MQISMLIFLIYKLDYYKKSSIKHYINHNYLLKIINSRIIIKNYLNQDYLLRIFQILNINIKYNTISSFLKYFS